MRSVLSYTGGVAQLPDWSRRGGYIESRSSRRSDDTDVAVAWANEARQDEARAVFDPDYASRGGRSTRTVGYSGSAGVVVTVITLRDCSDLWGVNAWRANSRDVAVYANWPGEEEAWTSRT